MNDYSDNQMRTFFCLARDRHNVNTRGATDGLLVPQQTTLDVRKYFFSNRVLIYGMSYRLKYDMHRV